MYRRQLIQGCRCLEIDIWDGARGEPDVTHGYTLVTRAKLKDVVDSIKQYAFKTSKAPVILSLDVKASPKQQVSNHRACAALQAASILFCIHSSNVSLRLPVASQDP
eukprot:371617-Pleurochrysis_carterae.AAC.2